MSLSISPNYNAYTTMNKTNFKARQPEKPAFKPETNNNEQKDEKHKTTAADVFYAGFMTALFAVTGYAGVTTTQDMYKWHQEKNSTEFKMSPEDMKFYEQLKTLSPEEAQKKLNANFSELSKILEGINSDSKETNKVIEKIKEESQN